MKLRLPKPLKTALLACLSVLTIVSTINSAQSAPEGSISINFSSGSGNNNYLLSGEVNTGIVAVPASKWNNYAGKDSTAQQNALNDTGAASGAMVTWSSANSWGYTTGVTTDLLKGYLDDGGDNGARVNISSISYFTYDLYIYQQSDSSAQSFTAPSVNGVQYTANGTNPAVAGAGTWGATQAISPILGSNVLQIKGLSLSALAIQSKGSSGAPRGGIAGLQLVNTYDGTAHVFALDAGAGGASSTWSAAFGSDLNTEDNAGIITVTGAGTYTIDMQNVSVSNDGLRLNAGHMAITNGNLTAHRITVDTGAIFDFSGTLNLALLQGTGTLNMLSGILNLTQNLIGSEVGTGTLSLAQGAQLNLAFGVTSSLGIVSGAGTTTLHAGSKLTLTSATISSLKLDIQGDATLASPGRGDNNKAFVQQASFSVVAGASERTLNLLGGAAGAAFAIGTFNDALLNLTLGDKTNLFLAGNAPVMGVLTVNAITSGRFFIEMWNGAGLNVTGLSGGSGTAFYYNYDDNSVAPTLTLNTKSGETYVFGGNFQRNNSGLRYIDIIKEGEGTQILTGLWGSASGAGFATSEDATNANGTVTIKAGTLQVGGTKEGAATTAGTLMVNNIKIAAEAGQTGTLAFNTTSNQTYSAVLTGLTGGNIVLLENNTAKISFTGDVSAYQGKYIVKGGTLAFASTNAFHADNTFEIYTGGTLDLSSRTAAYNLASLKMAGGTFRLAGGLTGVTVSTGSLTVDSSSNLNMRFLEGGVNDKLSVTGSLSLATDTHFNFILSGGLTEGMSFTVLSAVNGFVFANSYTYTLSGVSGTFVIEWSTSANGNDLIATLARDKSNVLFWNAGTATWDMGSQSWLNGNGIASTYSDGKDINFTDAGLNGTSAATVTLGGTFSPATVLVNNSEGTTYTFSGSGLIAGAGALTKEGAGTLVIETANTYTGGTFINGGILRLTGNGSIGSGTVTFKNNAIMEKDGHTPGGLFLGQGTLVLNAGNTKAGDNWLLGGDNSASTATIHFKFDGQGASFTELSPFQSQATALGGLFLLDLQNVTITESLRLLVNHGITLNLGVNTNVKAFTLARHTVTSGPLTVNLGAGSVLGRGVGGQSGDFGGFEFVAQDGTHTGDIHFNIAGGSMEAEMLRFGGAGGTGLIGNAYIHLSSGTLESSIRATASWGSTINGSMNMLLSGGSLGKTGTTRDFNPTGYSGGNNVTTAPVSGNVSITLTGDDSEGYGTTFLGIYDLYGGAGIGSIGGNSTITLKDITKKHTDGTTGFANNTTSTISGGNATGGGVAGTRSLVFDHYTTEAAAKFIHFQTATVKGSSDLTLLNNTNASIGSWSVLGSTLTLGAQNVLGGGSVTLDATSHLKFGLSNATTGEAFNSGSLTTSAGSQLSFHVFDAGYDSLTSTGTMSLDAGTIFNISLSGTDTTGREIVLMTGTGASTFVTTYLCNLTGTAGFTSEWVVRGNSLVLRLRGATAGTTFTWRGDDNATWSSQSWDAMLVGGTKVAWETGKNAFFSDEMGGDRTVDIDSAITAGTLSVETQHDLVFSGSGSLTATSFTKNGSGSLTLSTEGNLGAISIAGGGSLIVNHANALGTGAITVNGSAVIFNQAVTTGTVTSSGVSTIGGTGTMSGNIVATGGTLKFGSDVMLAGSTISFTGTTTITSTGTEARTIHSAVDATNRAYTFGDTTNNGALTFDSGRFAGGVDSGNNNGVVNVKSNVSFLTSTFGGWGQTFNVDASTILNLGHISSVGKNKTVFKQGLGTVRITDYTATVYRRWDITAGAVEFDLSAGKNVVYGSTAGAEDGETAFIGAGKLIKSGTGTLQFTGAYAHIFTGGLELQGGTLLVANSNLLGGATSAEEVVTNRNITVNGNVTLGTTTSTLTNLAFNTLTMTSGSLNVGGTLTTNSFTISGLVGGSASLTMDVIRASDGALSSDAFIFAGAFTASGMINLNLDVTGTMLGDEFTLFSWTGSNTNALSFFRYDAPTDTRVTGALKLNDTNTGIIFEVTGELADLVWAGGNGTWDIKQTDKWTGAADRLFWTDDAVVFGTAGAGTAGTNNTITLNGALKPSSVEVTGLENYIFTGAGSITGKTGLVKNGTGSLTINTDNSYTGGTMLNDGSIILGHANALGTVGTITFAGGTLQYADGITTDISARVAFATGSSLKINTGSNMITWATAIGDVAIQKDGAGTLSFTHTLGTYSGALTLTSGTLEMNSTNDTTLTSTITGSGKLIYKGANALTLNANMTDFSGTLEVASGSSITLTAAMSGRTSNANLVLGENVLLTMGWSSSVVDFSGVFKSITLKSGSKISSAFGQSGGVLGGNLILDTGAGYAEIFSSNGDRFVLTGKITGTGNLLRKEGNQMSFRDGWRGNDYVGLTEFTGSLTNYILSDNLTLVNDETITPFGAMNAQVVNSGIAQLKSATTLIINGRSTTATNVTLANGFLYDSTGLTVNLIDLGVSLTISGPITVNAGKSGNLNYNTNNTATVTLAGGLAGSGDLSLGNSTAGTSKFIVGDNMAFTGGLTLGANITFNINNSSALTLSATLAGAGKFEKSGAGALTISQEQLLITDGTSAHSFAGGTTVSAGTLILGGVNADGIAGGNFQFSTGALSLQAGALVRLSLSGGEKNNYTFANDWNIEGDSSIVFAFGGAANHLSGAMALSDNMTLTLSMIHGSANALGGMFLDGALTGSATTRIVIENSEQTQWSLARNLHLTANNENFLGTIEVSNLDQDQIHALALYLDHANAAKNASIVLDGLSIDKTADIVINTTGVAIANLIGDEFSRLMSTGAQSLTISSAAGTFAGVASGAVSVVKQGAGAWILTGANTSTGTLTISEGSVELGSSAGTWAGNIVTNANLIFNHTADFTFAQDISGTGLVTKNGSHQLTISGNNSYIGDTVLNGGTVILGSATGFSISHIILNNSVSLDLGAHAISNDILVSLGANATFSGSAYTGTVDVQGGLTLGSATAGSLSLNGASDASGILDMAGFNAGAITVKGFASISNHAGYTGIVDVQANGNLSATGMKLKISGNSTLRAVSGAAEIEHSSLQLQQGVTLTLASTYALNAGQTIAFGDQVHAVAGTHATMSGNLRLNGGSLTFYVDGDGDTIDQLTVTGTLSVDALTTVKVERKGSFVEGDKFLLMTSGNVLSQNELDLLSLDMNRGRSVIDIKQGSNALELYLVVGQTDKLVWDGAASGDWSVTGGTAGSGSYDAALPWQVQSTPGSGDNHFYSLDDVIFTNDGIDLKTVNIKDAVNAASILVNGTGDFVFTNDGGSLTGQASFEKQGSGSLTINGDNSLFMGSFTLDGGTLQLNNSLALGSTGSIHYKQGNIVFEADFDLAGRLHMQGSTAINLEVGNTFTVTAGDTLSNIAITKTGDGTLKMNLVANQTNAITLTAGILEITLSATERIIGGGVTGVGSLILKGGLVRMSGAVESNILLDAATLTWVSNSTTAHIITMQNNSSLVTGLATSNRELILKGNNSLGSSFTGAILTGDITTDAQANLNILGMAGDHSLRLTGNIAISGSLNLADNAKLTIGAAAGKTQSFAGISTGAQTILTMQGDIIMGGNISGAGLFKLAGGTLTSSAAWSNALATELVANTMINTGAYDVSFGAALTSSNGATLTKTGAGKLSLNAVSNASIDLAGGSLDIVGLASTIQLTVSGQGTSLSGANALAQGSVININGGLTTIGDIAGTMNLNNGAQLNLTSGIVHGDLNVSGTASLNKAVDAAWTSMELAADTVLDYKVAGNTANLVLGNSQSLTVTSGAQLKGGLTLDGGNFSLAMNNAVTGDTVLTLQSGGLTVSSATGIDIGSVRLVQRGDYTFTLVAGAGLLFDLNLLSLEGWEDLNLISAPVLTLENGNLVLNLKAAASLVWAGDVNQNLWSNSATDKNWLLDGQVSEFKEHDFVIFNDNAANHNVVLVSDVTIGNLRPTSMTVDSVTGYTFSGTGNITATGKLIQVGSGSLTFANAGVNTFLNGIDLRLGAGKTNVSGGASLEGDLTINAELEITSSAISNLRNVQGAGAMTINGKGGVVLSGTAGSYTGTVTVNQGSLNNQNVIAHNNLSVVANGNVTLTGITNNHLNSLKTTKAGVTIFGLAGSITTVDNSFALSMQTSNQEVIHFGAAGGSLDMGTLNLVFDDILLLDPTGKHTFKITDGVFGSELWKHDDFGKYKNFVINGASGDMDDYYVLGIDGGSVIIGGLKAYENFVLDVNNKWTPHITQKQAAEFTAKEFMANENDQFKTVTVDGVLKLIGVDGFILNSLSGASTGWIGTIDGAQVTINGDDSAYNGTFAAGTSDVIINGTQSMMGRTDTGTLTLGANSDVTIGGLTSVAGELTLEENSQLTINSGAQVRVSGDVTLGTGSSIVGEGTLTITQGGQLVLGTNATLGDQLIINLLATGGSGDAGSLDVGDNVITIGGLTGTGTLISGLGGLTNIDVSGDTRLVFKGSLEGDGGTINKLGAGTQVLAAKTDKDALYNLSVEEGTLVVDDYEGQSSADYGDIKVGMQSLTLDNTFRVATPVVTGPTATFVVNTKMTATGLNVNSDGRLVIGSEFTNASLTVTGSADFKAGSAVEMFIGNNGDQAMIKVVGDITGLDSLGSVTLHAAISWQAYVKTILFESDNAISGTIDLDKIIMDGFGNQTITKTEDDKKIIFEASRSIDNNPFRGQVSGQNALAGLDLIWAANIAAGAKKENIDVASQLGNVFNSIAMMGAGSPESHRLLAAVAGATVTSLAGSQRDDFRQQQTWIRNRTVGMGISPDYVHEDLPYVNSWIQANAGTKRISSDGDEAGYNLDTFGGTVGFDVDVSSKLTWGFAFSADYNKLTASGAESAKGRNDAYYANLFLRTQAKRWAHTVILTAGWNDAKLDRTVTGIGVNYTAEGTTKGSSFGAMYEATYDYTLNENKTSIFQPLFNLSIASASMDAYTEQGAGNAGLQVDGTDATYGTASLGARLIGTVGENVFGRTAIGELRLQVAQDFGDDTHVARVGLGGIQRDVIGTKVGKTSLQLGAGISVPVTDAGTLYFDANADFRSKATDVNGSIGYRVNF